MPVVPARGAVAIRVSAGQSLKVTNTHGNQVIDFWAISPTDTHNYLSMVHTRTVLARVCIKAGDGLYTTRRKPMLTLVEDTTPGVHDMVWSACDPERYRMLGVVGYHASCADNFHNILKKEFPELPVAEDWIPDPLNLFMNVAIDHRGGLEIKPPVSKKGQHVLMKVEQDAIIVMSCCPNDMQNVNAGDPTDCEYDILDGNNTSVAIPTSLSAPRRRRVKVCLSFDFDAVSHWIGTGGHPDNNMADYSSGVFSGQVGVIRLLNVLKKTGIADKVTWFIPGHTAETFPSAVSKIYESGAEIGLHGYSHENIYHMTPEQERDVLEKCIEVATKVCNGKKPRGYRAPMYTIRETTVNLLREHEFLYDTSLMHHDSQPYWTPADPPIEPIDFKKPASSWLKPTPVGDMVESSPLKDGLHPLVEIPCGWYNEDMMPLQYLPHLSNSMGYVSTRTIEQMWKDKFTWLWDHYDQDVKVMHGGEAFDFIFPILMHPDTSGMAHLISLSERIIDWLKSWGDSVEFCRHEQIAESWLAVQKKMVEKK